MTTKSECIDRLVNAGIKLDDARALRRIAMTLHRWYEMECGSSDDYSSWVLVRGIKHKGEFTHDDDGNSFIERHVHKENKAQYIPVPDRERGAEKRLAKIMAGYPSFSFYLQTDPRGAPLYILRPGDIPEGADVSSCYNRGIAVCK